MKDIAELFWSASLEEVKQGYIYDESAEEYICLICGQSFVRGVIYSIDNVFYEAEKFMEIHLIKEHNSMFNYLLNMDKKYTGLTDHQKSLLEYFHQGCNDKDIAKQLGVGSTSTIRSHRFSLREKEKQSKIFLAIMELLGENPESEKKFISIPRTAVLVDDRFAITAEENEKILKAYFKEGLDGPLSDFPAKEKRKIVILKHILKRFELNKEYTEKEVNEILGEVYFDHVTLRRYLIEYGFMNRRPDGSSYWIEL